MMIPQVEELVGYLSPGPCIITRKVKSYAGAALHTTAVLQVGLYQTDVHKDLSAGRQRSSPTVL